MVKVGQFSLDWSEETTTTMTAYQHNKIPNFFHSQESTAKQLVKMKMFNASNAYVCDQNWAYIR